MPNRILTVLRERWRYWLPHIADPARTRSALARFYAERQDYHQMTAGDDKIDHPQVRLFLQSLAPDQLCVEFGCGGGVVLRGTAARTRAVVGLDIAAPALARARQRLPATAPARLVQANIAQAPLRAGCADVAYSFEVLEHVWDPAAVLTEMIRVLKPGGRLFLTTPNGFSLDLHLPKRTSLVALDHLGALGVWARSVVDRRIFRNTPPDLDCQPVYADCDMITKTFPRSLRRFVERAGCAVERLETFFFQQAKAPDETARRRYAGYDAHWFYRHFGDHILLVARKR